MVRSGFHNSLGTDIRTYYNSDFSHLMSLMIKDGVHQNYGHQFITLPGSGLEVIVQTGECWFNEVWVRNDADLPITVPTAPIVSGYSRIDAVAIKIDNTTAVREGTIEYVAGTASSSPVAPTLTDTDDVHWHLICLVTVPANATSINAANIENKIGTTTTPFITGILNTIDITTLLNQWSGQFSDWMSNNDAEFQDWFSENTSEFQTWFQHMKDQLSEDAAGHLQEEIDNIPIVEVIEELSDIEEMTDFSGEAAGAKAVKGLYQAFSSALTALKNTAIAQAVGATGDTFASVISKLGEIINRGKVTTSIGLGGSYTIPEGYHNGQGKVSNSVPDARNSSKVATLTNADGRRVHSLRDIWRVANSDGVTRTCFELPATGYYENTDIVAATDAQIKNLGWLIPSGTKTITANGNNQDVKAYASVNVSVHPASSFTNLGDIRTIPSGYSRYIVVAEQHQRDQNGGVPSVSGCGATLIATSSGSIYGSGHGLSIYYLTSAGTITVSAGSGGWLTNCRVIGVAT